MKCTAIRSNNPAVKGCSVSTDRTVRSCWLDLKGRPCVKHRQKLFRPAHKNNDVANMAMAKTTSLDRLKLMPSQDMPEISRVTTRHPKVKLLPIRRLIGMASDLTGQSSNIPIGAIKTMLSKLANMNLEYAPSLFAVCVKRND